MVQRYDPYLAFNFWVEIDGIQVGGFTEVSGLTIEVEVQKKKFGGLNDTEFSFITGTKYTNLTLKHGLITDKDFLWDWIDNVIKGKVVRKDGTIYLRNHDNLKSQNDMGWDFFGAYPIKWDGPALNAASNTVATETLVLTHQKLTRHR
jgi:phage tail-like protein